MKLKELDKSLIGKSAYIFCPTDEKITYIFAVDISDAYYSNIDFGNQLICNCIIFEIPKKRKPDDCVYDIWKSNGFFFPDKRTGWLEHIDDTEFEFMEREEVLDKLHSFIDDILLNKSIKKYASIKQ